LTAINPIEIRIPASGAFPVVHPREQTAALSTNPSRIVDNSGQLLGGWPGVLTSATRETGLPAPLREFVGGDKSPRSRRSTNMTSARGAGPQYLPAVAAPIAVGGSGDQGFRRPLKSNADFHCSPSPRRRRPHPRLLRFAIALRQRAQAAKAYRGEHEQSRPLNRFSTKNGASELREGPRTGDGEHGDWPERVPPDVWDGQAGSPVAPQQRPGEGRPASAS